MTYASGMGPLPDLLEVRGGSKAVMRAFASAELPLQLVNDRAHRVPLAALIDLFDTSSRLSGDSLFGLNVGAAMMPGEYGTWVRYALQAPTLGAAILRLSRCLVLHQVGGRLAVSPRPGGRVIWSYDQTAIAGSAARQHDDHVLPVMIKAARAYLGDGWTPCWIETRFPDPGDATAREDTLRTPWRFARTQSGIVMPAKALLRRQQARRHDAASEVSSAEVVAEIRQRTAEHPVDRISALIALRLMDRRTDIDGAARMSGLARHGLQRKLHREGLTYSMLLDRARMSRARALVLETSDPLSEIAFDIGYSDPAHFTRAFRRHFGYPPSALRKRTGGN